MRGLLKAWSKRLSEATTRNRYLRPVGIAIVVVILLGVDGLVDPITAKQLVVSFAGGLLAAEFHFQMRG